MAIDNILLGACTHEGDEQIDAEGAGVNPEFKFFCLLRNLAIPLYPSMVVDIWLDWLIRVFYLMRVERTVAEKLIACIGAVVAYKADNARRGFSLCNIAIVDTGDVEVNVCDYVAQMTPH